MKKLKKPRKQGIDVAIVTDMEGNARLSIPFRTLGLQAPHGHRRQIEIPVRVDLSHLHTFAWKPRGRTDITVSTTPEYLGIEEVTEDSPPIEIGMTIAIRGRYEKMTDGRLITVYGETRSLCDRGHDLIVHLMEQAHKLGATRIPAPAL